MERARDHQVEFPLVWRGYDPAAVERHVRALERRLAAATEPNDEQRRVAQGTIDAAQQRAAAILTDARRSAAEADARLAEIRATEHDRGQLLDAATVQAQKILGAARERAAEVAAEVEALAEEARSQRWADVGDRVARIMASADDEAGGIVAEAHDAAERLREESVAAAQRVRDEADGYAAEARSLAEEWAAARLAAAEADQAKAAEVLIAACARAQRIRTEAEDEAALLLDAATRRTTDHVQELLSEARYDLEQLEQRANEARSYLHGVRELATRTLDTEVVRPVVHLATSPSEMVAASRPGRDGGGEIDVTSAPSDAPDHQVARLEKRSATGPT